MTVDPFTGVVYRWLPALTRTVAPDGSSHRMQKHRPRHHPAVWHTPQAETSGISAGRNAISSRKMRTERHCVLREVAANSNIGRGALPLPCDPSGLARDLPKESGNA